MNIHPLNLDFVKAQLRQNHSGDDVMLQNLLNSAIQEALRFMNRSELPTSPYELVGCSSSEEVPSSDDPVSGDVCNAIVLLIQADYDGDPLERPKYRTAAEAILFPYRGGLGV